MLANSGDPDQTLRFAAFYLGLRCLLTSHKKDAMLISEFEQRILQSHTTDQPRACEKRQQNTNIQYSCKTLGR